MSFHGAQAHFTCRHRDVGRAQRTSTVMTKGVVVIYFSRLGGRLGTHQKVLEADAKVIAHVRGYDVGARQPLRQ